MQRSSGAGDHGDMKKFGLHHWYSHALLTVVAAVVLLLLNGAAR